MQTTAQPHCVESQSSRQTMHEPFFASGSSPQQKGCPLHHVMINSPLRPPLVLVDWRLRLHKRLCASLWRQRELRAIEERRRRPHVGCRRQAPRAAWPTAQCSPSSPEAAGAARILSAVLRIWPKKPRSLAPSISSVPSKLKTLAVLTRDMEAQWKAREWEQYDGSGRIKAKGIFLNDNLNGIAFYYYISYADGSY